MFYRKDAVFMAVASLLAANGFAMADSTAPKTSLSLDPTVITADAASDRAPLMWALDKAGAAKPLDDLKLNIYGWVESGYTYNHRHGGSGQNAETIIPGPFNHEFGNHYMLNQVVIRFERAVATDKFDVGGMIEVMYGSDAARIHSSGLGYNGSDATDDGSPADPLAVANNHPILQFDIPQAYLTVNVPVGSGLQLMIGKFVTLLGYETIDPRGNPFYSHSYIFGALPFTQTGVLGTYQVTDKLKVIAGVTRGWDQSLEDGGEAGTCAVDGLGQFSYVVNKQLTVLVNWSVGPQNIGDTSHYRTVINPIAYYQVNDQLKLGLEGLYLYDGGLNGDGTASPPSAPTVTHAYGDAWGAALYASYMVNDYLTVNGRFEKFHTSARSTSGAIGEGAAINIYSITLGTTITPMPKDPLGKNISIRPEIRYDFSDTGANPPFTANGGTSYKDQLTFAADVVVKF